MEPLRNETEAMLETKRWTPSAQMTTSAQRLLLVLEKQRAGELPSFLSEEINKSLDRLLTQSGPHALHTAIRGEDVASGEASVSNEPLDSSFLEAKCSGKVPSQLSEEIDAAAIINAIADSFLGSVETAVQILLCDEYCSERNARGLYADWFDEEKVAAAIRLFPRVLSKKWNGSYPINWQTWKLQELFDGTNIISFLLHSLSLIPLLAKLRVELDGRFREEGKNDYTRGGLLSKDVDGINVLQDLCLYPWSRFREEDQRLCDETIVTILETLRDEHLLKKEDIREHDLVGKLFCLSSPDHVFPEHRFRFLSDWDPTTLARPIESFPGSDSDSDNYHRWGRANANTGLLPIHCSIEGWRDVRAFSVVCEAGFRHYPEKLGFVFFANEDHRGGPPRRDPPHVPYVRACENYGPERVASEVLNRIIATTTTTAAAAAAAAAGAAGNPKLTPEGFLLAAVADKTMDWMGLHLLVRTFPGALSQIATNMRGRETSALRAVPVQRE